MAKKLPKILILNNSVTDSRKLHSLLMGNNFDPIVCREAMNALFLLSTEDFDFFIASTNFEDMVLAELVMLFRDNEKTSKLPLLLLAEANEIEMIKSDCNITNENILDANANGLNLIRKVTSLLEIKEKKLHG